MKSIIYICGPMTGLPEKNYPAFNKAAQALRKLGYEVRCPTENGLPNTATWGEHMRADIAMLLQCTHVVKLKGSSASKGARIELSVARGLGMPVANLCQMLTFLGAACSQE